METKICGCCKKELDLECFAFKDKSTGKRQSYCKECHKEYRDRHYSENKEAYYDRKLVLRNKYMTEYVNYLKTLKCTDCGNNDFRVIEFDHLGDKSFNVSERAAHTPLSTLMKEIEKCEPVCCNCHRIRTVERGSWYQY